MGGKEWGLSDLCNRLLLVGCFKATLGQLGFSLGMCEGITNYSCRFKDEISFS